MGGLPKPYPRPYPRYRYLRRNALNNGLFREWLILQQDQPDDYVLATGEAHSVREFVEKAFAHIGRTIVWHGSGVEEKGFDKSTGETLVEVDPRYFRPTEVDSLLGDSSKARAKLGWRHRTSFDKLVSDMVKADMAAVLAERERRNRHA